jgi:hypothetical protein
LRAWQNRMMPTGRRTAASCSQRYNKFMGDWRNGALI